MKLYMAPMEGVTGYIYRKCFVKYYGGGDKYFTPFITPHLKRGFAPSELRELLPENNEGIYTVPQILTNNPDDFNRLAAEIAEMGYREININLGCPSSTVTAKNRGSGLLRDIYELEKFLDGVYSHMAVEKISVKTRTGYSDHSEWEDILAVYNKFPVYELIVHPRLKTDMYKNRVNLEAWEYARKNAKSGLVYNGDICSLNDALDLMNAGTEAIMIGRGLIRRPWLFKEILNGRREEADPAVLRNFMYEIFEEHARIIPDEKGLLCRMKELWSFTSQGIGCSEKQIKRIKKAKNIREYNAAVENIFDGI